MKKNTLLTAIVLMLAACSEKQLFDASGTFEAEETMVSAEGTGLIKVLRLEEGQVLKAGENIGYIDTVQLHLKKKQLEAQIKAMGSRLPDIPAQTGFYKQQLAVAQSRLDNLLHEQKRIQNLVKADAATTKQLDDVNGLIDEARKQLEVVRKQDAAQVSMLTTQSAALRSDVLPLYVQIEQLNDQIARCCIVNPIDGTVLTQFAEANEMAAAGKPLYKIANLTQMTLRAYVTGDQFSKIKLNQVVNVLVDQGAEEYKTYPGVIEWISDKAEFTPKTIQTKAERANLVYAVKIGVKNDGFLKIGMYGEIKF
ncbi:MAG: HlyD family efflux transporter periplasmic adaptor subunit [Saprospiraceae bacterium]|nr:HlyD family efflux transporter periplasmic adaptor subunit [Saprospiraceae bacterium]